MTHAGMRTPANSTIGVLLNVPCATTTFCPRYAPAVITAAAPIGSMTRTIRVRALASEDASSGDSGAALRAGDGAAESEGDGDGAGNVEGVKIGGGFPSASEAVGITGEAISPLDTGTQPVATTERKKIRARMRIGRRLRGPIRDFADSCRGADQTACPESPRMGLSVATATLMRVSADPRHR